MKHIIVCKALKSESILLTQQILLYKKEGFEENSFKILYLSQFPPTHSNTAIML